MGLTRINNNKIIDKCYEGKKEISSIYYGNDLIYEKFSGLCFTCTSGAGAYITIKTYGYPNAKFWYSYDHTNWTEYLLNSQPDMLLGPNKKLYIKGKKLGEFGSASSSGCNCYFQIRGGTVKASGILSSLYHADNYLTNNIIEDYEYYGLFRNCTNLTDISGLYLFSTSTSSNNIGTFGCTEMFKGSGVGLITSILGQLKLTTHVSDQAFESMFYQCQNITIPNLYTISFKALSYNVCACMFYGCTNLNSNNITLKCTLTNIPKYAFRLMFANCTNLQQVKFDFTGTNLGEACYENMFQNCTSLKVPSNTKLFPSTTTPITFSNYSCSMMFYGCTNLSSPLSKITIANKAPYRCFYRMYMNCNFTQTTLLTPTDIVFDSVKPFELGGGAFQEMFYNTNISLYTSQTNSHYYVYKIPDSWNNNINITGASVSDAFKNFANITPTLNTTYYTGEKFTLGG